MYITDDKHLCCFFFFISGVLVKQNKVFFLTKLNNTKQTENVCVKNIINCVTNITEID